MALKIGDRVETINDPIIPDGKKGIIVAFENMGAGVRGAMVQMEEKLEGIIVDPTRPVQYALKHLRKLPTFWILGEDMASGLVGPFQTLEAAEAHHKFQADRGDASVATGNSAIITDFVRRFLHPSMIGLVMTPEQDRAIVLPD